MPKTSKCCEIGGSNPSCSLADLSHAFPAAEFICEANTPRWHRERMKGITSSQAAGLFGVGFKTRLDVWVGKTLALPPEADIGEIEYVKWGNILEPVVAQEFQKRTGVKAIKAPGLYRNKKHPLLLSTPDYFVWDEKRGWGILEIKTTSAWNTSSWANDCPIGYEVQLMHQLATMELSWGYLSCLVGGQRLVTVSKEIDREFADAMTSDIEGFWADNVVPGVRPPAKCHKSAQTLSRLYPDSNSDTVTIDGADLDAFLKRDAILQKAKEQKKAAETIIKQEEACIKDRIGESLGLSLGDVAYTWKTINVKGKEVKAHTVAPRSYRRLFRKELKNGK